MKYILVLAMFTLLIVSCAGISRNSSPLKVVEFVDLERYLGLWYEIASYPAWFTKDCTATTAEYSRLPDGKIRVINRCRKGGLDGPLKKVEGKAEIVDPTTNAKLQVWFFWPFKGNYWIIDLDDRYQWAVVGEPTRKYLWILSRKPDMDDAVYAEIVARLGTQGYDPERLTKTLQPLDVEEHLGD